MNYAVKLGIACDCNIRERNEFARKNYFYADLPRGIRLLRIPHLSVLKDSCASKMPRVMTRKSI